MNLEEEEKQMVGIDHAGQDCDLSGHCQDFFQCDSSIQNKICSQSRTRHLISMNINIDMLLKYSYKSAHFRTKKNGTSSGQIKIEAKNQNIKNHIDANNLEGLSLPCYICEKIFKSC